MKKRLVSVLLAGILATTTILSGVITTTTQVQAAENYVASVTINQTNKSVVVGNDYITRTFFITDNKVSTTEINNKRANLKFAPQADSEEFIISTIPDQNSVVYPEKLNKTGWVATASSQNSATLGAADGPGQNMLDNNDETIWHTNYGGGTGTQVYPHSLTVDLQSAKEFSCFSYLPRQGSATNGDIAKFNFYVSDTLEGLATAQPVATGTFAPNGKNRSYINLDKAYTARYVKLEALTAVNGQGFAGGAEFDLHATKAPENVNLIKASDLTLNSVTEVPYEGVNGKTAKFKFNTYQKNGIDWDISMYVTMNDNDHYMRKFIEISVPDAQKANAKIDYIDLESMNVQDSDTKWTHPSMGSGVGGMSGYVISLGQPVYIQGMFFGSEFPMTETEITDNKNAHMRYFSGKSFTQLGEDNQLTKDGKYVTWQTVAGAARSTDMNVIQTDFFSYIDDIATKTDFRRQFNSWYDNMMTISDESVTASFLEMEKGFTSSGVKPMDSYVVDDGWNNYNSSKYNVNDVARSGTTQNSTGFWEFNTKFPNGFDTLGNLSHKFDSQFGVWLGPRGGYNYNGAMGRIIEDGGNGAYNAGSGDIDVGDRRYQRKLTEFFINEQNRNKVNYWKLDGFATAACNNKAHDHMTGGPNGMYYFSDTWEGWIDLFEDLRENAKQNEIKDLWLNLTCYVNPSPWILQWGNSVWLQVSQDIGRTNIAGLNDEVDKLLTYRDGTYFDFIKEREFQFPFKNIYNHDPIYGVSAGLANKMNDDQFRIYLYMMATRGTAFWELYYSPSMMDEGQKWMINSEFLTWLEDNFHILQHSKIIGERPDRDGGKAYGYSAWDDKTNEGIISMRNSSNVEKTFTYKMDNTIGVPESIGTLHRSTVLNYKTTQTEAEMGYNTITYGTEVTVTLKPGESRIWKFSADVDTKAPVIENAKSLAGNKLQVKFDEALTPETAVKEAFTVEGNTISAINLKADFRTVELTLGTNLEKNAVANVAVATTVKDKAGNAIAANTKAAITYYEGDLINSVTSKSQLKNAASLSDVTLLGKLDGVTLNKAAYELSSAAGVKGKDGFTVSTFVRTISSNTDLVKQEGAYTLKINDKGQAVFTVGDKSVTSTKIVNNGNVNHIAGVRENNGLIKLYINGELEGSKYGTGMTAVTAGVTTLGSSSFAGALANTAVYNGSYGYDQVDQVAKTIEQEEFSKIPQSIMTATANSQYANTSGTGDGPASYAIDGKTNSWWHTDYSVAAGSALPHWIQITLSEPQEVSRFAYTPRAMGSNGNLKNYTLEVSTDGTTFTKIKEGVFEDDGKVKNIDFTPQMIKAVRLNAITASYGQQPNKFASVAEINLYKQNTIAPVVDYSALGAAIAEGEKYQESLYTAEQYAPLKTALTAARAAYDSYADEAAVTSALTALTSAIETIKNIQIITKIPVTGVTMKATTTLVIGNTETLIVTVAPEDASNKVLTWSSSDENVATVTSSGLVTAIRAGQATITAKAHNDVKAQTIVTVTEEAVVNKTELQNKLNEAKKIVGAGYTEKSFNALQEVIKSAQTTFDNPNASDKEIDERVSELTDAIAGLELLKNDGWYTEAGGQRYYKDGVVKEFTWVPVGAKWQYAGKDGYMAKNWVKDGGSWYYLNPSDGIMKTGWLKDKGAWYYLQTSGKMKTGWQKDGGSWYYLQSSGIMKTGWLKDGGAWYYLQSSGKMKTGWVKDGGAWYYLQGSGKMKTGWLKEGGAWYFLQASGKMKTGWLKDGGAWYYLEASGKMKTGWQKDGASWYYLQSSGKMKTGWLQVGTAWYYLQSSGKMATGWLKVGTKNYYFNPTTGIWNSQA